MTWLFRKNHASTAPRVRLGSDTERERDTHVLETFSPFGVIPSIWNPDILTPSPASVFRPLDCSLGKQRCLESAPEAS